MEYKGYSARVEFDQDAGVLFGEVEGLRDAVTFEATNVKDLERVFRDSVEDYLAMCAERDEQPEKPYSGKFLVRMDSLLHREVAMAAARAGTSLNAFTSEVLKRWLELTARAGVARIAPGPNVNQPDTAVTVFESRDPPAEVAAVRERTPELWPAAAPNTPSRSTPDTPGKSLTPQQNTPEMEKAA